MSGAGVRARSVPLRIDVFTVLPGAVEAYLSAGVLGRAVVSKTIDVRVHDLRSGATDSRRSVDDAPFGGGPGMVLMPEPVFAAVEAVEEKEGLARPLLLLTPGGRPFDQAAAAELAALEPGFSLLCGRYEGVDQRVADHLVDGELSIGDFVLAGGEVAALAVVETVARLVPGVLGNADSAMDESFSQGFLEYPQYTRPREFRGWKVPDVLRSGDHDRVARWRRATSLRRTLDRRPDLMAGRGGLTDEEAQLLREEGLDSPEAGLDRPEEGLDSPEVRPGPEHG